MANQENVNSTEVLDKQPAVNSLINYSGLFKRFVAFLIDVVIIYFPVIIVVVVILTLTGHASLSGSIEDFSEILIILGGLIITVIDTFFITRWGATPGKMILKMRIINKESTTPRLGQTLLRETVGRFLSGILYLGYIWIAIDKNKQGFHDKISGTFVVNKS